MQDLVTAQCLQGKRGRLKRSALYALVLTMTGCGFGFVGRLTNRVAPKPDYYRLLFTELARQTFLQTSTPTIVKENENTLALFEREYNARNAKQGLPSERLSAPKNSLMTYSYLPDAFEAIGARTVEIPFYRIIEEQA